MHDTIQKLDVLVPCEPILLAVGDLYQRLCRIPDRRADRGKRYSLAMVLTIAILAKLAGEDTCTATWCPYVAQVFRLETTVTDKATEETWTDVRYGITSQPATVAGPKRLLAQVRQGWSIETGLHGRRDGTLREDASRVRTGDGPHVLAVINNTVVGLALQDGQTNLAEARRKYDHSINRRVTVLWVVHQIQQAQHGNPACAWSKNMVLGAGRPSGMPALGFG